MLTKLVPVKKLEVCLYAVKLEGLKVHYETDQGTAKVEILDMTRLIQ